MNVPHPSTLNSGDLSRLTGYIRQADIEKWCHANGVKFFRAKAGIWTTMEAVNLALGLRGEAPGPPTRIEF